MYSSWDIGCGVKHRIPCHLGYFSPFTPPPPPPSNNPAKQNFQKVKKKVFIHYHFAHVHHKWRSYDVWWDMVHDRQIFFFFFFHVEPFSPFYPTSDHNKNQNFEKMKKNWKYYHFTHVYHKWQSYDVQFPRYETWWTEFFVTFDDFFIFCYFTHLTTQKIKIYKK